MSFLIWTSQLWTFGLLKRPSLRILGSQWISSQSESGAKIQIKPCKTNLESTYRFVPSQPIWKRFDVSMAAETEHQGRKDSSVDHSDQSIFEISRMDLPPRTKLDMDVIKLLERLSLVNFGTEKSLLILEEAIRYADPLLTELAFQGTTNNNQWSRDKVEPLYSLCEELYPNYSCPLDPDLPDINPDLANHLFNEAPNSWEGYIVAPPGNIQVEPKGIERSTHSSDQ